MARRHSIAYPRQHIRDWISRHLSPSSFLPACLHHPRDFAVQRQLAETQTADAILAQEPTRTPAAPATVSMPAAEFGRLLKMRLRQFPVFCDFGGCGHEFGFSSVPGSSALLAERHSHLLQQGHA